jgi:hypothetical protein
VKLLVGNEGLEQ